MYRIKTIKELCDSNISLVKLPQFILENTCIEVDSVNSKYTLKGLDISNYSNYITDSLAPIENNIYQVIGHNEFKILEPYANPTDELRSLFNMKIFTYNWYSDYEQNYWYWSYIKNTPAFINRKFIKLIKDDANSSILNSYTVDLSIDNIEVGTISESKNVLQVPKNDFFKLTTEEEFKINLNQNCSYIAKRDFAGYKKGDIFPYTKFNMMTGDPLVVDLNTGKETRIRYDDYECRDNTKYLKMKQDN